MLHTLAHRLKALGEEVYLTKEKGEISAPKVVANPIKRIVSFVRLANKRRRLKRHGKILPRAANGVVCHASMPVPTKPIHQKRPFIVLYPEIVDGNPLQAQFVVRWLLHRPNFFIKDTRFSENEMVFFYQNAFGEGIAGASDDNLLYQRPFQLTCAQARVVMEAMALGSLARKFQALQQASTMSS